MKANNPIFASWEVFIFYLSSNGCSFTFRVHNEALQNIVSCQMVPFRDSINTAPSFHLAGLRCLSKIQSSLFTCQYFIYLFSPFRLIVMVKQSTAQCNVIFIRYANECYKIYKNLFDLFCDCQESVLKCNTCDCLPLP